MSSNAEFNTFGQREKSLVIQAVRKQGYIPLSRSETWINGRHGRTLYVRIGMWTPDILCVDYENEALWNELYAEVKAFVDQVQKWYDQAEDELIKRFDDLAKGAK